MLGTVGTFYSTCFILASKATVIDNAERAKAKADLYHRVSLALGPKLWVTFSDDTIWQLQGSDTWHITQRTSLRRHPKKTASLPATSISAHSGGS